MYRSLPTLPERFSYRLDLAPAATPRLLKQRAVHRWFYFPHSYSPELVEAILDDWALAPGAGIVDPFVGAGTTLLVAQARGYDSLGLDLSPLSVIVSNAKAAHYNRESLHTALDEILELAPSLNERPSECSPRLARALSDAELLAFWGLQQAISRASLPIQGFMLLGLLAILPQFSRAAADGGWFRWVEKPDQAALVVTAFRDRIQNMMAELPEPEQKGGSEKTAATAEALCYDARKIDRQPVIFDGLITSPPYPNRHDYSRVFQIELLTLGCSEDSIFQLRHSSLRSHVEARAPDGLTASEYHIPPTLQDSLVKMTAQVDARIPKMLKGYAEDMFYVLRSARKSLKQGGRLALVVGNVRYGGVLVPVDEIIAEIGQGVGLDWEGTWVIRLRGNSAQQMGQYCRVPARESVVFLNHP
jgi:hypothetical protein